MYTNRKTRISDEHRAKHKKHENKDDHQNENGLIISFLNCYAAGIFFATCILHMLPEISEKMKHEILKEKSLENVPLALVRRSNFDPFRTSTDKNLDQKAKFQKRKLCSKTVIFVKNSNFGQKLQF